MSEGYETFKLIWGDYTVMVSHHANWLNSGHYHIELRCGERLPVTETGYRSIFLPEEAFTDGAEIKAFVTSLLDDAATSAAWQTYLADSRQLKLF